MKSSVTTKVKIVVTWVVLNWLKSAIFGLLAASNNTDIFNNCLKLQKKSNSFHLFLVPIFSKRRDTSFSSYHFSVSFFCMLSLHLFNHSFVRIWIHIALEAMHLNKTKFYYYYKTEHSNICIFCVWIKTTYNQTIRFQACWLVVLLTLCAYIIIAFGLTDALVSKI